MGLTKRWLMEVMESMGKDELDQEVLDRANDLMEHWYEEAEGER